MTVTQGGLRHTVLQPLLIKVQFLHLAPGGPCNWLPSLLIDLLNGMLKTFPAGDLLSFQTILLAKMNTVLIPLNFKGIRAPASGLQPVSAVAFLKHSGN